MQCNSEFMHFGAALLLCLKWRENNWHRNFNFKIGEIGCSKTAASYSVSHVMHLQTQLSAAKICCKPRIIGKWREGNHHCTMIGCFLLPTPLLSSLRSADVERVAGSVGGACSCCSRVATDQSDLEVFESAAQAGRIILRHHIGSKFSQHKHPWERVQNWDSSENAK